MNTHLRERVRVKIKARIAFGREWKIEKGQTEWEGIGEFGKSGFMTIWSKVCVMH